MKYYSVGFLHNDEEVTLISKNRPEWQAGHLNGVGGHIEINETPLQAMVREFEEEAGIYISKWDHFLTLVGSNAYIYCFATNDNGGYMGKIESKTDEKVDNYQFINLATGSHRTIPNLKWILPLMRQRAKYEHITVDFIGDA